MKYKKIFVLGYFGYKTNQLDGQTIRTRNVYELIKKNKPANKIRHFDSEILQHRKITALQILKNLFWCDQLIYLPGKNNLNKLLLLIEFTQKIRKISIVQVAIGGWLHEYITKNKKTVKVFKTFDSILLQSKTLAKSLTDDFGLVNATYFPNYRIQDFKPKIKRKHENNIFKIVFMARVVKEKGIDKIFEFADFIKTQVGLENKLIIDFYGPIILKDRDYFNEKIKQYDFVNYKGVLQPDKIYKTLSNYDVLLLPTRYEGEGFPGTILDAYISGVPVIVSNWKFIPEFVEHGKTGFIYHTQQEFFNYILKLCQEPQLLFKMKKNAFEKSKEFSEIEAWKILKNYL